MHRVRAVTLSLAIVCLAACASSSAPSGLPFNVTVVSGAQSLGAHAFSPDTFTVSLAHDSTVIWRNADVGMTDPYGYSTGGVPHKLVADDSSFVSDTIQPGAFFTAHLTHAGTIPYHCAIHPTMTGVIVITS